MVSEVDVPELETRVAILRTRAEAEKIRLGDEVAYLIASYVKSNVRELEGSLIKIAAHAAMYNQEIGMDLVRKVLKNYIAEKQKIITIEDIIATVSQFFGMKSTDIRGPSRKGPVAKARQVVMFLARELGQLSASAVGQELGNRHHTTVLHGHSFIKESMNEDPVLKNQVRQIENSLQNKE
jgi:chromosomal replication initiator protein